jgi:predicted dehydrogenase
MLNIGIIGVGGAGRAHAFRFNRNPSVGSVFGFDIKKINVHGVSVCSPDDSHYEYIVKCLEAGKHVLVEKPMVASLAEAEKLEEILETYSDLVFGVHHQMRYVPAFVQAKHLLENGDLGSVFYVEANYWHDMRERNVQFDDWRVKKNGQSVIYGGACHPLDLIMYLLGSEPSEHHTYLNKNAYSDYPQEYTAATSTLMFDSGVVAKCHTNNCVVFPQMNDLIILGDKATYIDGVLYRNRKFETQCSNTPRRYFKRVFPVTLLGDFLTKIITKTKGFRRNPQTIYNHDVACEVIVSNFVESVLGKETPLVGYLEACKVIKLCEETEKNGKLILKSL